MRRTALSIPEIAIISGTRAALGAGVGLLLADRLTNERRRGLGWLLLSVGVLSTIPIAIQLMRSNGRALESETHSVLPESHERR